ncbi:MAG: sulfatase [Elusimicrobiota bacterium]
MLSLPCRAFSLNVVLIVWDTVRSDHTTPQGYVRDTTPHLAALARRGLWFSEMTSDSGWTLPNVSSLFSGERTITHGVFSTEASLPPATRTLAQIFAAHGYRAAAFTGGLITEPHYGLARGFDPALHFDSSETGMGAFKDSLDGALRWLDAGDRAPFFLFIHGADAHYPYRCPASARLRFAAKSCPGPVSGVQIDGDFLSMFDEDSESGDEWMTSTPEDWDRAAAVKKSTSSLEYLRAEYDGCLSYADEQLPRLEEELTRRGLWKDTVLILMSDHGEELGERGTWGHYGLPLNEGLTRVPLLIMSPTIPEGLRGSATASPAQTVDVSATLLDLEGWPRPEAFEGRSLAPILAGASFEPRPAFSAAPSFSDPARRTLAFESLRLGRWKILRDRSGWRLYDLAEDPGEVRDVGASRPDILADMLTRMTALSAPGIKP